MSNPYSIIDGFYTRVINGVVTRIAPAPPGSQPQIGLPGRDAPVYSAIAGSDFNVTVTGTTSLPTAPPLAAGVAFTVAGGDIYYTVTGTAPSSSSPSVADTAQVQIDPLADALAFRCIVKASSPHLAGYWLKQVN